jgi:hypothetical protein
MVPGRTHETRALAHEVVSRLRELSERSPAVGIIAEFAGELGLAAEIRELADAARPGHFKDAAIAELHGDFGRAAGIFGDLAFATKEAGTRLRLAQDLIDADRRAEGEAELQKALAFYRSVGATFFI